MEILSDAAAFFLGDLDQFLFQALPFADLAEEFDVRGRQLGGTFPDTHFQVVIHSAKRFLRFFAFGDVDHDAAQLELAAGVLAHAQTVAQPHNATIRPDHAVFQNAILFRSDRLGAELQHPVPILCVQMIFPEVPIPQPALGRITQQSPGLLADKSKLRVVRIRFPNDSLDGMNQGFVVLLGLTQHPFGPLTL